MVEFAAGEHSFKSACPSMKRPPASNTARAAISARVRTVASLRSIFPLTSLVGAALCRLLGLRPIQRETLPPHYSSGRSFAPTLALQVKTGWILEAGNKARVVEGNFNHS